MLRGLHAIAVVGVFAGAQVSGERIEGFQKSMQSPRGNHRDVGLVDVVFLNVLQHFAEHTQRPVGLVVRGLAKDIAQTDIEEDDDGNSNDGNSCEAAHRFWPLITDVNSQPSIITRLGISPCVDSQSGAFATGTAGCSLFAASFRRWFGQPKSLNRREICLGNAVLPAEMVLVP